MGQNQEKTLETHSGPGASRQTCENGFVGQGGERRRACGSVEVRVCMRTAWQQYEPLRATHSEIMVLCV